MENFKVNNHVVSTVPLKKRILFISPYRMDEINANGFMQYYSLFKNDEDYSVDFVTINKFWLSKKILKKAINLFLPFRFTYFSLFETFANIPSNMECDYLIIDSDPYILRLVNKLLSSIKYKHVIYRQSDPISLINENEIFQTSEELLISKATQVWLANHLVEPKLNVDLGNKSKVLVNPIKICKPSINVAHEIKHLAGDYKRVGVYYGKLNIDLDLMLEVANKAKDTLFLIFGNYPSSESPKNLLYLGYRSLPDIYSTLDKADFLFLPYIKSGKINDLLYVTAKILAAVKFDKPVLACNVAKECSDIGISLINNSEEFVKLLNQLPSLKSPLVNLIEYDEKTLYKKAKSYLNELDYD